jgi:hypothetical protein
MWFKRKKAKDEPLPHWACVAFVARCARLVLPIFDAAWPDAPAKRRDGLLAGIFSGEESAKLGKLSEDSEEADFAAVTACGVLHSYIYAHRDPSLGITYDESENFPVDLKKAELAVNAATVAAKVTETARAEPGAESGFSSFQVAMEAFSWALVVAENDPALLQKLRSEYQAIQSLARTQKWTHATPVVWKTIGWCVPE